MSEENVTREHDRQPGYYGRPIVKPPEWTDLIPFYFFTGGFSGGAAMLGFAERLAKNDALARPMVLGAGLGSLVSGFCLVADLKRPERFLNMLRVFKPTSPMSIGVYVFSAFGSAAIAAAAVEITGIAKPLGRVAEGIAGLLGPVMATYTAVLIGDTVVPAWHYGRTSMPLLFAGTSASSAGAWGMLVAPAPSYGAARRLAIAGGVGTAISLERLHAELGTFQQEAYKRGEAGLLSKTARVLNLCGLAAALFAKNRPAIGRAAGALLLAGGLAERFGVFRAGCVSTKDPEFVIRGQRERIGDRPQPETPSKPIAAAGGSQENATAIVGSV